RPDQACPSRGPRRAGVAVHRWKAPPDPGGPQPRTAPGDHARTRTGPAVRRRGLGMDALEGEDVPVLELRGAERLHQRLEAPGAVAVAPIPRRPPDRSRPVYA